MNSPHSPEPNLPIQPKTPMPQQPADGQLPRHHVHNSYIWLESIRMLAIVIFAIAIANISTIAGMISDGDLDDPDSGLIFALLGGGAVFFVIVVLAIVIVSRVISYKHLYFTVGPAEFTLCSGIFNKKKVHVPYQRIQSVDQRATLVQRIFGVCTVSIDTAGGASNKAVVVPYMTKSQAEWLRTELYNHKAALSAASAPAPVGEPVIADAPMQASEAAATPFPSATVNPNGTEAGVRPGNVLDVGAKAWNDAGGIFAGAAQDTGRVSFEYGLTNKELFLAGLSNSTSVGIIMIGLIVGILQIVGYVFELFGDAANTALEGAIEYASTQTAAFMIGAVSGAVILAGLVLWVISAVGSCISYGGFKARRRSSRIEVEYGLLQHTFQGVSIDRVQSVVVKQSFIRRIFGYCELSLGKIDAADDSDDTARKGSLVQQGLIIHPFVKVKRVPEILEGIIPEFSDLPEDSKPVAKVALRRAIIRRTIIQGGGFWLAVIVVACMIGVSVLVNGVLDGSLVLDSGDEHMLALLYTFGNGALVLLLVLAVIIAIIDIVGAVLWARESSFAYNKRFMQISNGGLSRDTVTFPRQKIQFGTIRSNPLQRHAGTDTLLATTAAGAGGTTTTLIDVPHSEALAWLDWVKPGGNDA